LARTPNQKKSVETLTHDEATRKNIPTAEYQSVMRPDDQSPIQIAYQRRNRDLDPQLVWRGKDEQDWSDLVVHAPPLYIQEKVHPKVLVDDLMRRTEVDEKDDDPQADLFADFNGLPEEADKTDFYQHDANWTNRMILGDSLQVMASLAEREGLRGKVQCIYIDPPYGIKFNSNFQWSTTSRDVKDGQPTHITREPEQVKAFRDTWRDGIHSYLTYLRDRLTVARDLLTDSGSIFVQIGDENVHRVRLLMDEVFGEQNLVAQITVTKTGGQTAQMIAGVADFILWYCKDYSNAKFRRLLQVKSFGGDGADKYRLAEDARGVRRPVSMVDDFHESPSAYRIFRKDTLTSQRPPGDFPVPFRGQDIRPRTNYWKTHFDGMVRLDKASRIEPEGKGIAYVRYLNDFGAYEITNVWTDVGGIQSRSDPKVYVVQSATSLVQRCILMATDPGDLVLDPTCGSGTTAYAAEQWGRRWITIDTSRVSLALALALARARIMGARYPYYLLADSPEGQHKEAEITRSEPSISRTRDDIRQGFVYERVPHITLKAIANNAEIDVIWEQFQKKLEPLRQQLNELMDESWEEWEIPRRAAYPWDSNTQQIFYKLRTEQEKGDKANPGKISQHLAAINHNLKRSYTLESLPALPEDPWPEPAAKVHKEWWEQRIARQREIDDSIAAKADSEYLYDKPFEDKKKVRVAGPFTVESLSPHRVLGVDENDDLIDGVNEAKEEYNEEQDFVTMILDNLKTAGVQQAHKDDKINFTSISPWPGEMICAEGRYIEGSDDDLESGTVKEKRAAIFVGPEFGTVSRPDLVQAAREAGDAGFDALITCAFNYDAHSTDFKTLGRIPVLKARMNADLHMADDLKNTGKGNLFVIFGEPDIDIIPTDGDRIQVKINGVDVFHPNTGEVRSDGADGIACWFIDTDYNEESFFVRHAYFLGANDPYKSLKTTLKAEINQDAWDSLNSDTSRPFRKPTSGRIAVKVINHLGDEVMKVFRVDGGLK
jgi:adenine-specific DNA-methyltransferase